MDQTLKNLPKTPGVYLFKNAAGKIIYIGKANSLRDRVSSYFRHRRQLPPKTALLVSQISEINHIDTGSEIDALLLEAKLIRRFRPKYNISLKDDKAYPLIEITWGDLVPLVRIVRRQTAPASAYFGPFPTGTNLAPILRFLRHVFPFVSQNHPGGKACLRSHLGLCPCPSVFTDPAARRAYYRNLKNLSDFFSGQRRTVQKRLENQMAAASRAQNFEAAAAVRNQLAALARLTAPRLSAWEYITNPNLVSDQLQSETAELSRLLGSFVLHRIECYDVATISGKSAGGARVVFVDAVPQKSLYRRYKLTEKSQPDDFAMMEEMLTRRFQNKKDPLPDLIVVDGGAGQLGVAQKVSARFGQSLPIIGLAKRLETIYLPDKTTVNLPEISPALHLLQKMRDEAHRFSRRYHFWQRTKSMLT